MAKSNQQVLAVLMPVAAVAWLERNNYRKDYGDTAALSNSLADRQWVPDNPVPACPISDEELAEELALREKRWDELKAASSSPDALAEKAVFELLYLRDGKLIRPEYSGNAGFRRARSFFAAMVKRFKDREKHPDLDISGLVPIRKTTYERRSERIKDQQLENEMQGVGTKKMDDLEKLTVTMELYKEGENESSIRSLYSSSVGQKTFGICQANTNWPKLHLYDRFYFAREHQDFIPWGPVRGADLVKMNNRFEAERKRTEGLPLKNDERGLQPISEEEADNYFRDKQRTGAGDGNAPKQMAKKDIEQGSKSHALLLVRKSMDSVLANSGQNTRKYVEHAAALNVGVELIDEGKGKEYAEIETQVASLIRAGRAEDVKKALASLLASTPPAAKPEGKPEAKPGQEVVGAK